MNILQTFGLNPYLTLAQIVNFLIVLYILKRYLYPPLFKVFKKREEVIKESLEKVEESQKLLEKSKNEEKELLRKARLTANEIIKDAKDQSSDIVKQAEEQAKKKTEKMLQDAKTQIEIETEQAQSQLNKHISNLALTILQKSLGNVFSQKEQSELVQKALKEMQKQAN